MPRAARTVRSPKRDALATYRRKRRFDRTTEPAGDLKTSSTGHRYLIQKHAARSLHYDFRLELDGTLKSWAVPKGPSLDPHERRLAVHVEDHPLDYGDFEGTIPEGEYGGGTVMLWDKGKWEPIGDPQRGYREGKLKFRLHGQRLRGEWTLVRMGGKDGGRNWLLIKARDQDARSGTNGEVTARYLRSVASDRTMNQIAQRRDRVWSNGKAEHSRAKPRAAPAKSARAPRRSAVRPGVSSRTLHQRISRMPVARAAPQPSNLAPQLATLVNSIPTTDDWLHEIKFDGYRLICFLHDGQVRLMTRGDQDWTARFPEIADALASLPLSQAILDGELIATDEHGVSNFQLLQNAMRSRSKRKLQLYFFDVPYCEGFDLTQVPLLERKALLQSLLMSRAGEAGSAALRYSDHVVGQGAALLRQACRDALEGVISKLADSPYVSGRGRLWVKSKCTNRQEFVIAGMTEPEGSRQGFGALLLGYYDDGKLVYSGRVGTGFTEKTLADLSTKLSKFRRTRTPFDVPPSRSEMKGVRWVEPQLVAEVQFAQWTSDGRLRQPSFEGLREDKEPGEVTRERAKPVATMEKPSKTSRHVRRIKAPQEGSIIAGVRLSNPERVFYPEDNITKAGLADFYDEIADWILPHITNRPLTLVRCPRGHQQTCFFQKHVNETLPSDIRGVEIREKTGSGRYIVIDDRAGLISLVQLGTLEMHPWGCRADDIEHPDRLVFDLDPGPGVRWSNVIEAAGLTRRLLTVAGLKSFVQTSGGKGLHVVVPLRPKAGWDDAKAFCRAVAHTMQQHDPARYIATMSKSLRKGKIYVDYLRNSRGATSVAPYSTRARAHAPVATPLRWDELESIADAAAFNVKNLRRRLAAMKADPWKGYFGIDQALPSPNVDRLKALAKSSRARSRWAR